MGLIRIIQHRGRQWRGHPNYIQRKETKDSQNEDDNKRLYYWAAVGYNFKSLIICYNVPTNKNGKMSHKVYIDSILEPVVSQWCLENTLWCLEEDSNSGYGKSQYLNVVSRWKEAHRISKDPSACHRYYFNCSQSPNLAVIKDTWSYPKGYA